jgi:serine/threonine-protein kinase
MLTPNGVKILDFGISVPLGEEDEDDTGATFGTPAYVAPERLDGMPAVPATDVYGLGVLLFEMVTGEPPYPVDTWEELAAARAAGPGTLPACLPPDFRTLVGRCLDDDPAARPPAEEVRSDLVALRFAEPVRLSEPMRDSDAVRDSEPVRLSEPVGLHEPAQLSEPESRPRAVYRAGRATASTLPMTPPPGRRLAVTLALAAFMVTITGLFALVNWPRPGTVDARPSAAPPATPTATSSPPATVAPSPPGATATPRLVFSDAVSRMRSAVEAGAADGEIRSDVALDLLNLIQPLSATEGRDVNTQVDQLRRKISERLGEGSLDPLQAELLRSRLADLDRAGGS